MIDEEENLHRQGDVVSERERERENENLVSYKNLFKRFFFLFCLFSYSFYSLTAFCLNIFLFFSRISWGFLYFLLLTGVIYWLMMLRIMKWGIFDYFLLLEMANESLKTCRNDNWLISDWWCGKLRDFVGEFECL